MLLPDCEALFFCLLWIITNFVAKKFNLQMDAPTSPRRSRKALIGINLLIMTLVAFGLGWLAFAWLDMWTGHGDEVTVPDVRGRYYQTAVSELIAEGYAVEISDSVYDSKSRPGYVVDQNPRRNTTVKPGRTIYLTINALSPKTVTLPRLTDISARQARAILEGLGLKNITQVDVISEFKDLVMGVEYKGRPVSAGARVPINAAIVLKVGAGDESLAADSDSVAAGDAEISTDRYDLF